MTGLFTRSGVERCDGMTILTYITATDACVFHLHNNIVWVLQLRDWPLLKRKVSWLLKHKGRILLQLAPCQVQSGVSRMDSSVHLLPFCGLKVGNLGYEWNHCRSEC